MVNFNSNFPSNDNLPPELRAKIEAALKTAGGDMNMLQFLLDQAKDDYNSSPQPEIGGFSPDMLSALQRYEWTDSEYPLKLSDLSNELVGHAPFFQQTRTFLIAVRDSGGIKLTAKGNLPRSFVNTMIDVFLNAEEKAQTLSVCKVLNEQDLLPLHEAHILGKLSGQIGRLKGQLKLRKNALKLLHPESAGLLYKILFIAFFKEYHIGYRFNQRVNLDWLQEETGYVLYTLQQYADEWIDPAAHTAKWLHPMMLEQVEDAVSGFSYMTTENVIERTFIEPFEKWGLLEVERAKGKYFDEIQRIRKTPLFDAFIQYEA